MQLTCPTCRSGLEVPDGTTAHVRCPACRTVFSSTVPPAPVLAPPPIPVPKPTRPAPPREEEDEKPRRTRREDPEDDRNKNRDGVPDALPKAQTRRRPKKHHLSPDEKRIQRASFGRATYGAKIIQISVLFYIPAVLFVPLHQIVSQIGKEDVPAVLVIAGILGLVNWILGLIGISLCLSGPPVPGHFRFGVSAIVVSVVHGVLLLAVVAKTSANADFRNLDRGPAMWAQIATQYESLSFFLAYLLYPDDIPLRRADSILSFLTGVVEMTRLILYLMTLGCLAQTAGDRELSERCTRMAGRVTIIPGILALGLLAYKIVVIETGLGQTGMMIYALNYLYRSITLVVAGILGMTMQTIGDVVEACEFPFQVERSGTSESVAFYDGK